MRRSACAAIWTVFILSALFLLGCGSKVERSIKKLEGSAEEREQAKMELTLAKQDAIEPLIQALGDVSRSPKVRVDVSDVLFRLYLREDDPRILEALIRALNDEDTTVRAGVATALGDMGKDEAVPPLVDALEKEQDDEVIYQILVALETLGGLVLQPWGGGKVDIKMADEQKVDLVQMLKDIVRTAGGKAEAKTEEILELIAEEIVQKAEKLVLQGDVTKAEEELLRAKELLPESINVNQKLGMFYFRNGQEEKGLEILSRYGMVAYAKKLSPPPVVDGDLDDPCWRDMSPHTQFYQCIWNMSAYPISGKCEAYLGYAERSLFVAVKAYEPSTETMTAKETKRDGPAWRDDNVDIYLDTNHDYKSYYQIVVNSLGTVFDAYNAGESRLAKPEWNGEYTVATTVEDTFWICEIGIPFKQLGGAQVRKGTVWGFNIAWVRIGNASEFGQWVPTYGFAHWPERFGFLFFE